MYLKIAGFLSWEKDFSNGGDLIALWPMMPQYCSFMRGERRLLATIRYQPYTGLPYLDIDRNRCVVFSYVDPLYYGLKPFSPTMVLKDVIDVDNKMTNMVSSFIQNGAFVSGLLKTEQLIDETDARFARERWQEAHGGYQNAGQVAVLGKGLEFQASSNTFREMVFPEVDARSEIRICMVYGVKPILLSAKAGLDRSTFSNYAEARQAWYEENVTSEWAFLEERITKDLLPHFDDNPNAVARFDRTKIKALQEDRNTSWKRADEAFKARVITRDEARKEKGLDPMEDKELGQELYMTVMEQQSLSLEDNLDTPNAPTKETVENEIIGPNTLMIDRKKPTDKQKEEEKAFRRFAAKRIEERKEYMIGAFEFKYIDEQRQRQLLTEFGVPDPDAELVLKALLEYVKSNTTPMPVFQQPSNINITANIEPGKAPNYELNMPDIQIHQDGQLIKSMELPTPLVNVSVQPTPIEVENKIEFDQPKIKQTIQKVKRNKDGDIDATVTKFEYEETEEKEDE